MKIINTVRSNQIIVSKFGIFGYCLKATIFIKVKW